MPHCQPLTYFLLLWIYLFWTFHVYRIIQSLSFCVWCLSLDTIFSRFTHVIHVSNSFCLLLENIPLAGYTTFHLSWGMCGLFSFFLSIINNISVYIHIEVIFCRYTFSVLLGTYLVVELLGHLVTLCLNFWGTTMCWGFLIAFFPDYKRNIHSL